MARIYIAWRGLPHYGARCIRALIDRGTHEVVVLATKPIVPAVGMEQALGQDIVWIDSDRQLSSFEELGLPAPDLFLVGGYADQCFVSLTKFCHKKAVPTVLMSDNIEKRSRLVRGMSAARHRLFLRKYYAGIFVPGSEARRYARKIGYRDSEIRTGLYAADPTVFKAGPPLSERPKRLLFVGRLIERKNVVPLAAAFSRLSLARPGWELHICGDGPQEREIETGGTVRLHAFKSPEEVRAMMQEARALALPSHEDHFGLVVHEAALCGCALALSSEIGAAEDLAREGNAVRFAPDDLEGLHRALLAITGWNDERWDEAGTLSRRLAEQFTPDIFADSVEGFARQWT